MILAFEPTNKDIVAAALVEKGLNYIKAAPSEFTYTLFKEPPSFGYAVYHNNISAAMYANVCLAPVNTQNTRYFFIGKGHVLPLQLPPCIVAFKRLPSNEVIDTLHRLHPITHTEKGSTSYTISNYSITDENVLVIFKHPDLLNRIRSPYGSTNVISVASAQLLLRIAYVFISTHVYPSYAEEVIEEETERLSKKQKLDRSSSSSSSETTEQTSEETVSRFSSVI